MGREQRELERSTDAGRDEPVATAQAHTVALVHADAPTRVEIAEGATLAPVALLSLAGALRKDDLLRARGISRVRVLDRGLERWGEAEAARQVLDLGAAAVVIASGRTGDSDGRDADIDAILGFGKRLVPTSGPAPLRIALVGDRLADAEAALRENAADLVLRGEADETLPRLLTSVLEGRDRWDGFQGLTWGSEERGIRHERDAAAPREHAAPAWDLVDLSRYALDPQASGPRALRWLRRRAARTATIVTSRACAPDCPTCHQSFGASSRDRSVRDVVAEIRDLVQKRGVRTLRIADHAFDGRPARAAEIARAIAKIRTAPGLAGLTVTFPAGLRGDGLSPELVDVLVDAGLRRFPLRVDTASPRLQRLLKSNIDLRKVARGIEHIVAAGAIAHLDLRLGLPTETTGEAAHTIRWARTSAAHTATFRPGRKVELGPAWTRQEMDDLDDFPALYRRALRSFYSCPRRAARLTRALPALVPRWLRRAPSQLSRMTRALA